MILTRPLFAALPLYLRKSYAFPKVSDRFCGCAAICTDTEYCGGKPRRVEQFSVKRELHRKRWADPKKVLTQEKHA